MKNFVYLLICFLTLACSKGEKKFGESIEKYLKYPKMEKLDNDIISAVLDFVPYISTIKGLEEAIMGFDMITGKNLTDAERILSLVSAIPAGNLLKNKKHAKNAQKFMKAAERAKKTGKIKKFFNFTKAAIRANKKANKVGKLVKNGLKVVKVAERFVVKKLNEKQK